MTEMQRHHAREALRSYAISFAISIVAAGFMSGIPEMNPWLIIPSFGLSFGTMVTLANMVAPRLRHRSFIVTCVLQAVIYVFVICSAFGLAMWMYLAAYRGVSPFDPSIGNIFQSIIANRVLQVSMIGSFLLMFAISSVFQISKKLGPRVLWSWMTGKYHEPREETRIFMFLDLKDSTMLGEKLGNIRFSALVRDFFNDLTKPVIETKAEVSHYIGDEAVLTWRLNRGLQNANCIELFYKMREQLQSHAQHYLKIYGVQPSFKAGAHLGPVVATEVGDIKSEIVYHGDVLNTSSRIQGHCNDLGSDFLISAELYEALTLPQGRYAEFMGSYLFKGKEHEVGVYAISDRAPASAQQKAAERVSLA
ncbi:MAG: adenylate/guanylate cyclase domain-containing protein [Fimbriimonadaceae bacterium]